MKTKILLSLLLGIIIASSLVSAFGVSTPYWDDNPLTAYRGSIKIVEINLQNMVGTDDVTVQAEITKGSEIASLDNTRFVVKAGTSDTIAPLKITIPEEYVAGDKKPVEIEFKTVASESSGMVSMGTGMVVGFDVLVTDEPQKETSMKVIITWIAVGVIVVLTALTLLRKKK